MSREDKGRVTLLIWCVKTNVKKAMHSLTVLPENIFRDVQAVSHMTPLTQNKAAWALLRRNLHHSPLLQYA